MKKVNKKSISNLSLTKIAVFVLVFLAIFVAAYSIFIKKPKTILPPPTQSDINLLLFNGEESDLLSFTVKPANGKEYNIFHHNNSYEIEGYPEYQLNQSIIAEMVNSLLYIEAEDLKFSIEPTSLDDFGLEEGSVYVEARFADNRKFKLIIGSRIPSDIPKDYALFNRNSTIYAINISLREVFDQQMNWLHTVPEINFNPDLLERISFDGQTSSLVMKRQSEDLWVMEEPLNYPVDQTSIFKLLGSINKMRFAAFIEKTNEVNLNLYGLDLPRLTVTFLLAPSIIQSISNIDGSNIQQNVDTQIITIYIGNDIAGRGFYCRYLDVIYQASDLSMGFLLEDAAASYISQTPLDIPLNIIDSLSITGKEGIEHKYAISLVEHVLPNNQLAYDTQGNIQYDYVITTDQGKEIPADPFVRMYSTMMSIRFRGLLDDFFRVNDVNPMMEIELNYKQYKRNINFYYYDALHAAMEVNGSFIHYIDLFTLDKINTQLSLLKD